MIPTATASCSFSYPAEAHRAEGSLVDTAHCYQYASAVMWSWSYIRAELKWGISNSAFSRPQL